MIAFRFMDLGDAEMIYKWRTSEHIAKYMYTKGPQSLEEHINWMTRVLADRTKVCYVIIYNDVPVGVLEFHQLDYVKQCGEWAFFIGDTIAQGKGIGRTTEEFALRTFFNVMQLESFYCEVFNFNHKVIENHKKFGFEIIGKVDGQDAVRMLLTKKRFHELNV